MHVRHITLAVLLVVSTLAADPGTAAAQDDCGQFCETSGGASAGPDGVSSRINGDGSIGIAPRNGQSNCSYARIPISGVSPDAEGSDVGGPYQLDDGTVFVWVEWRCADEASCDPFNSSGTHGTFDGFRSSLDCDGDGIADGAFGDILAEIGNTEALAAIAFDTVPWPDLEIDTFPDTEVSIISGFEIPLLLDDGAGTTFTTTFEADADDNGLIVTATGTARTVEWDTSPINAQFGYGHEQFFECDTFGEAFMPSEITANPCVVRWRGSSSGQVDNEGTQHRVSLEAVVVYDIEYETNLPGIDVLFGAPEFDLEIERNGVPVNEIQVVHVARDS